VVLASPVRDTMTAVLELPPRSAAVPLSWLARMEVARVARCAPELLETSLWDVPAPPRGGDATSVMTVGLAHERARVLLDLFEATGAEVAAIDLRGCALARWVPPCESGSQLVVDIGWGGLNIVLLVGGRVIYERNVGDISVAWIYERLEEALGLEREAVDHMLVAPEASRVQRVVARKVQRAAEALATELRRSIGFAHHRYAGVAVERIVMCGDGSTLPGLQDALGRLMDQPVVSASARSVCSPRLDVESQCAAAIGLSIPFECVEGSTLS
jgi:Tfp pilus assembly PilM family ATPase